MISQRRWCHTVLLLLAFLLGGGAALSAAVPNAPQSLRATVGQIVFGQPTDVHLMWSGWDQVGAEPTHYVVYRAMESDTTMFDSIGTVPLPADPDSGFGRLHFTDRVQAGYYLYYIKAGNDDGLSDPSNTVSLNVTPLPGTISFTTTPPGSGQGDSLRSFAVVGQLFSYDADAAASNGGAVTYELVMGPQGMTVDPATGLVQWTPTDVGHHYVTLQATLQSDSRVKTFQAFHIIVRSCATPVAFYGRVVDQNGNGVDDVTVTLNGVAHKPTFEPTTITRNGGYYVMFNDAGTYLLRVEGNGIVAEWYQDSYERALATQVTAGCGDTIVANFTVDRPTGEQIYTVSGTVTTSNGNQPVEGAVVQFIGYNVNVPDSVKWESSNRFATQTDANGNYEIPLSNQYRYIARVSGIDTASNVGLFTTQYYNLANDPTQASTIELTGNLSDIDFDVDVLQGHDNTVRGYVRDSLGNPVWAIVVAYRVTSQGNHATVEAVQSYDVGYYDRGSFRFTSLPPGKYVFYAIPQDRIHIPGYYTETGFAALTWQEGTQVQVTGNSTINSIEIVLERRAGVPGQARLRGAIAAKTGRTFKVERTSAGVAPLVGAMVAAVDAKTGSVSNFAYTDGEGRFEITGLTEGDYRVVVDKGGYTAFTGEASIDEPTGVETIETTLEQLSVSSVPVTGAGAAMELAVYPNPASSRINLRLAGAHGPAQVAVMNVRGEEVLSARLDQTGADGYLLDAGALTSGIYFIRMQVGASTGHTAVRIVR
jgi:Carboxypeptidase regulatory-like domain/Secretion system C-terminal sorting domain/Putative Ig domain